MSHVKHLGWEMELTVTKLVRALSWLPQEDAELVLQFISPVRLRRAVADCLGFKQEQKT